MRIRVEGGHPLEGTYTPSGNSNGAIVALAAALMTDEPTRLHNMPKTTGIDGMITIAERLGASVTYDEDTCTVHATQITGRTVTEQETSETTAALLYLAPILVRRRFVRVEMDFPLNRVRPHLEALRDLGFDVISAEGGVEVRATQWHYADIILTQTSVTATAIVMMLAAALGRETVIRNAASEPHLQSLAYMLELMGAQVHGTSSNVLHVFGCEKGLHGPSFKLGPDYIEVASVAAISALCGGRVQINGTRRGDMRMIGKVFKRLGMSLDIGENDIFVPRHETLELSSREEDVDASIDTAPWPGFPSDLVAIATLAATQANGTSLIHEKLYSNRLIFVDKLKAMGAQIVLCDPHRAIVVGPTPLFATYLDSPDVRTGLGMLGATLVAQGESTIDNAQVIRRTFDGVVGKLKTLGAQITIES